MGYFKTTDEASDNMPTMTETDSRRDILESFYIDLADDNIECSDDGLHEWADAYATNATVYYADALAHFAGWVFWSEDGSVAADQIEDMGGADLLGDDLSPTAYVTRYTALALYLQATWAVTEALTADGFDIADLAHD